MVTSCEPGLVWDLESRATNIKSIMTKLVTEEEKVEMDMENTSRAKARSVKIWSRVLRQQVSNSNSPDSCVCRTVGMGC